MNTYTCECHQIGGRFIAEDPDCPEHGTQAQAEERRVEQELSITFEEYISNLLADDEGAFYDIMDPFKAGDVMAFATAAFEAGKKIGR
jgi:hypothetical protein